MALLLQFALSFAHVHKHDLAVSGIDRTDVAADIASAGHARSTRQTVEKVPVRLADDGDDHCPICFSNFLLSTSSIPDAPANQQWLQFAEIDRAFTPVSDRVFRSRQAAFQSRAPPVV